ncbi:hypothetical protein CERZMDRAFT_98181 [Cercospora zeae-maydis SCOH1-5]|uniref:Uncharacterized protein n=1 Tax=Cercospora zeae-maydis SCOH1-5 TaxID=717836 RepID=A0A6A6FEU8_9PEZI|nr:hypothetical protein CERZMDRAFT_98181 [Cercospora zeae-maydis SCOH1-5]
MELPAGHETGLDDIPSHHVDRAWATSCVLQEVSKGQLLSTWNHVACNVQDHKTWDKDRSCRTWNFSAVDHFAPHSKYRSGIWHGNSWLRVQRQTVVGFPVLPAECLSSPKAHIKVWFWAQQMHTDVPLDLKAAREA